MGGSIPEVDSDEDGDDAEWQAMQVTEVEAHNAPNETAWYAKTKEGVPHPHARPRACLMVRCANTERVRPFQISQPEVMPMVPRSSNCF